MAYYPLEELKKGNINFLQELYNYTNDIDRIIQNIRNSKDIDEILANSLYKLQHSYPRFLYRIIYDNPKYERTAYRIFKEHYTLDSFSISELFNMYNKTNYGKIIISYFYKDIVKKDDDYANALISMLFMDEDKNYDVLQELSLYDDLHIRSLFMRYLIKYYPNSISNYYDDITKYFTSYTHQVGEQMTFCPELMNEKDLCLLCVEMLNNDSIYFNKTKEYILTNYESNSLASSLLSTNSKNGLIEFKKDADRLFKSSTDYKIFLYEHYSKYINEQLITELTEHLKYFNKDNGDLYYSIERIYNFGLGDKLQELIDKYLSLSSNDKYKYLGSGSTTSSFRIGDFCFKFSQSKWSYEDIICPDIYLILKDLEEIYIRDNHGIIVCGIEVQPYLCRSGKDIDDYKTIADKWYKELDRIGYVYKDKLINGSRGCNAMLLDDYRDANTTNPELLPDWFKETPLVLVDRDMVYQKGKSFKQQSSNCY